MAERKIGVAMDFSPSSKKALRWAIDNLVRRGDTLVLLHVRHHGREEGKNVLWSRTGSRKSLLDCLALCTVMLIASQPLRWVFLNLMNRRAALVPLEELMEPPVRQRYDVPYDAEVFDMLNAAARQKEVRAAAALFFLRRVRVYLLDYRRR
jgi:nucleotide-binding universal stress UspA family protein